MTGVTLQDSNIIDRVSAKQSLPTTTIVRSDKGELSHSGKTDWTTAQQQ